MLKIYTPLPLLVEPSFCVAWLDMSDISAANMTASGGLVSKILNKTGNNNNLQQATTSAQPKNNTRTLNGLPVLEFAHDGTANDFMQFNSNTPLSEPFTVFVVGQYDTSTNLQALIGRQTAAISGQWVMRKEAGGTLFNSFLFTPAGSSSIARSGSLNPAIHCAYYQNGGSLNYSINNASFGAGTARSGYDNAVSTALVIGADNNSLTSPLDGFIAEIIIYNKVLNASQIVQVNQYLSRKWGIAIS